MGGSVSPQTVVVVTLQSRLKTTPSGSVTATTDAQKVGIGQLLLNGSSSLVGMVAMATTPNPPGRDMHTMAAVAGQDTNPLTGVATTGHRATTFVSAIAGTAVAPTNI